MVWIASGGNIPLFDTERGVGEYAVTSDDEEDVTDADTLTSFNTDGFSLGVDLKVNTSGTTGSSWTFRKSRRFFDVVSWTGDSSGPRTIAHNLDTTPGMIIIRDYTSTPVSAGEWKVYHKNTTANPEDFVFTLNDAGDSNSASGYLDNTPPTSSSFVTTENTSAESYTAYVFADDTATNGIIRCGRFLANTPTVSLGWRPQFVFLKRTITGTATTEPPLIFDTSRDASPLSLGIETSSGNTNTDSGIILTNDGFEVTGELANGGASAAVVFMAIREEQ